MILNFFTHREKGKKESVVEQTTQGMLGGGGNYLPTLFFLSLKPETKKKRVTAGEVDKLGKELGNCTHQ